MSWTSKALRLSALTLALFGAGAAIAGTIVVRSTGPSAKSYPPGKALADNSKVTLRAGDKVTILDGQGTRVLSGPGTYETTATASAATESALGKLLRNTGARQARTGATRGTGAVPGALRAPSLWFIDVTKSGTMCLASVSAASLWRPATGSNQSLSITSVNDGKSATLDFRAGLSTRAWPVEMVPITGGGQYRISGTGMSNPTTVRIATLGPNPQGLEGTVSELIKNGCDHQLDLIVDTVALPGGDAAPAG